jgi:hypothetical protein
MYFVICCISTVPLLVNRKIKVQKAPKEITGFKYLMIWHPRVNTDAAHAWLRGEIRRIGKKIGS